MLLEAFFAPLLKPCNLQFSRRAKDLLIQAAERAGDWALVQWVNDNPAYEYTGLPPGWTAKEAGKTRIGLNTYLLGSADTFRKLFVAGHELGHLRQFLRGETEGQLFSCKLCRQEVEASAFALCLIQDLRCSVVQLRYKSRLYHRVLGLEAAFPVFLHAACMLVCVGIGYLFDRLLRTLGAAWIACANTEPRRRT